MKNIKNIGLQLCLILVLILSSFLYLLTPVTALSLVNEIHVGFGTAYTYDTFENRFTNGEVMGNKSWISGLTNSNDAISAITDVGLTLDSPLEFDGIWPTPLTMGPPTEWSFGDIVPGQHIDVNAGTPDKGVNVVVPGQSGPFIPGFDASRSVNKTIFTKKGTQTLTITVTPRQAMPRLNIGVWAMTTGNVISTIIYPTTDISSGINLAQDGSDLSINIQNPLVGTTYTYQVIIQVTPLVPKVEIMPGVSVSWWDVSLASGPATGSSLSRTIPELGTWTWSAAGDYGWQWSEDLGRSVSLWGYIKLPPEVTNINPDKGMQGQTLSIVITGTNFTGAAQVKLGAGIIVNSFSIDNDSQITANVTIGNKTAVGLRDVSVTTPIGKGIKVGAFIVLSGAATVSQVAPDRGMQGQTLSVVITGTNFTGATQVKLGAGIIVNSFSIDNDTQITANITIGNKTVVGPRDVSITNLSGTTTMTSGFTVLANIPSVAGRILTPEGVPFIPAGSSCVKVSLRLPAGEVITATEMNGEGYYKLEGGIPAGDYELYAESFGANNPYADSMPVPIHIEEGQTLVQDIYLTDPLITGYVFTPDGQPFIPGMDSGVNVILRDNDGKDIRMGGVNEDGSYKLGKDIPAGDYFLYADTNGNSNPYASAIPVAVQIVEGQPLTQNIYLTDPSAAGMVYTPDGQPFIPGEDAWVKVCLKSPDGADITGTRINSDGSYKLPGGVPTGDYVLYAYTEGINNPYASAIPVAVHIVEGQTLNRDICLTNPSVAGMS